MNTVRKQIDKTDLHPFIADYIEENFNKNIYFHIVCILQIYYSIKYGNLYLCV